MTEVTDARVMEALRLLEAKDGRIQLLYETALPAMQHLLAANQRQLSTIRQMTLENSRLVAMLEKLEAQ